MYYEDKVKSIEDNILYQMKEYTFDFKAESFSLDIVQDDKEKQLFKIYHCKEGLCAYFKAPTSGPYLLKVIYDQKRLKELYSKFLIKIFKGFFVIVFFLILLSTLFAFYSLRPMKEALTFLEDFLKDLIHDLNTPATSILLNSKLLRKRGSFEEIERIELSAKSIASLYKNLEFMSPNTINKNNEVLVNDLVIQRVDILKKLYPKIQIRTNMKKLVIKSNKNALERIIDNLLSNACKYNKKNGQVDISIIDNKLFIKDSGIGIKNTKKVFERYYKENACGLGIGMNIVKQLCDILDIKICVKSEINKGTTIYLEFN